jgi:inhibitor of cysteine peptidase
MRNLLGVGALLLTMMLTACTVQLPATQPQPVAEAWQPYRAESGYAIQYPLNTYSMRTGISGPEVLFPGVKVIEPNDSFYYREPRGVVYKISIAVTENSTGLTLDNAEQLLTNSQIIRYDPVLLEGKSIEPVELGGEPALRVADLPSGPAGITAQIVAIHGPFVYELMVEPHQLTGNQAVPYVEGAVSPDNQALVEQIIATFQFVGDDTPAAAPAPPAADETTVGQALVETVEVQLQESFPVRVNVVASGYLRDACTEIAEIRQQFFGEALGDAADNENTFYVDILTVREAGAMCAQVLVPFEETIALDVAGLPAGAYTVVVNEVKTSFELAVDN